MNSITWVYWLSLVGFAAALSITVTELLFYSIEQFQKRRKRKCDI